MTAKYVKGLYHRGCNNTEGYVEYEGRKYTLTEIAKMKGYVSTSALRNRLKHWTITADEVMTLTPDEIHKLHRERDCKGRSVSNDGTEFGSCPEWKTFVYG